jgi:hypothetical protein
MEENGSPPPRPINFKTPSPTALVALGVVLIFLVGIPKFTVPAGAPRCSDETVRGLVHQLTNDEVLQMTLLPLWRGVLANALDRSNPVDQRIFSAINGGGFNAETLALLKESETPSVARIVDDFDRKIQGIHLGSIVPDSLDDKIRKAECSASIIFDDKQLAAISYTAQMTDSGEQVLVRAKIDNWY